MGYPYRLYFKRSGTESHLSSKYFKPRWKKDPKLLQTPLNKLFKNQGVKP